jgi:hypothetical protein
MKRSHWLLVAMVVCLYPLSTAQAIPIFYCTDCEQITKVLDFPNTDDFKLSDGTHIDLGYKYKQFQLMFLPLWNYDGEFCGYTGKSDEYVEIKPEELTGLLQTAKLTLPEDASPTFWDKVGGKTVLVVLVLVMVGVNMSRGNTKGSGASDKTPPPVVTQS